MIVCNCLALYDCAVNNGDCYASADCSIVGIDRVCSCKEGWQGDGTILCEGRWFDVFKFTHSVRKKNQVTGNNV